MNRTGATVKFDNNDELRRMLRQGGVPPLAVHDAQPGSAEGKTVVPAVRRRSWQQIGRMLEMEDARRERTSQPPAAKS